MPSNEVPRKPPTTTLMIWHAEVQKAALAFEGRWTMAALKRVNPDIAERLADQRDLFVEMCVTGSSTDIVEHGGATCRGFMAAVAALEAADEPHDAYWLGKCPDTGTEVAVGPKIASAAIVRARHPGATFLTPDEVAALVGLGSDVVAQKAAASFVAEAKRLWPEATVEHITAGGKA